MARRSFSGYKEEETTTCMERIAAQARLPGDAYVHVKF